MLLLKSRKLNSTESTLVKFKLQMFLMYSKQYNSMKKMLSFMLPPPEKTAVTNLLLNNN